MIKGLEALHHPRIKSAKVDISAEGKHGIGYMFFDDTKQYTAIEEELKEGEKLKREIEILHFIRDTFSMRNALLQVCDKNSKVLPERKRLIREYLLKEELL